MEWGSHELEARNTRVADSYPLPQAPTPILYGTGAQASRLCLN